MARPTELEVAAVLLGALPADGPAAPVLVANDQTSRIEAELHLQRVAVTAWHRRASGRMQAAPWPPSGPFASAIVRLPMARAELEMTLHAVASVVSPGGTIWLYGANDEGIKSAAKPMAVLFGDVLTVDTRGHCRVLSAARPTLIPHGKADLAAWRHQVELEISGTTRTFATYPGLFALGRLDPGTRLLLAHMPQLAADAHILDFGCGMGVIAVAARMHQPRIRLTLVDNDAVAHVAARENVPDAEYLTALSEVPPGTVDAILSNPPIHDGKSESHTALQALVGAGPALLKRGGIFQIVVQRRVGAAALLRQVFGNVSTVAEDGVFQLLRATSGGRSAKAVTSSQE